MNKTLLVAFLSLAVSAVAPAYVESYQLSGKSYEATWPKGSWNGSLSFPGVYCATAPLPEKAERLTQAMFDGNAIYVAKMEYPEKLLWDSI